MRLALVELVETTEAPALVELVETIRALVETIRALTQCTTHHPLQVVCFGLNRTETFVLSLALDSFQVLAREGPSRTLVRNEAAFRNPPVPTRSPLERFSRFPLCITRFLLVSGPKVSVVGPRLGS